MPCGPVFHEYVEPAPAARPLAAIPKEVNDALKVVNAWMSEAYRTHRACACGQRLPLPGPTIGLMPRMIEDVMVSAVFVEGVGGGKTLIGYHDEPMGI